MKNVVVVALLILSLSVVMAYETSYKEKFSKTYYFEDDLRVVSKTVWIDYDTLSGHKNLQAGNDKRFSTRDYRHGYSYRASGDYFDRKYSNVFYKKNTHVSTLYENKNLRSYHDKYYFDSERGYRYDYVSYLRSYEKRECYTSPPRDKLFYIKC